MMHDKRVWSIHTVDSAEELARLLAKTTQTLCSGFQIAGHEQYLFLNDATSEDGAAEYGVIKGGFTATDHQQIESITFSWCSTEEALVHIRATLAGSYDASEFARPVTLRLETPNDHGRCPLCK